MNMVSNRRYWLKCLAGPSDSSAIDTCAVSKLGLSVRRHCLAADVPDLCLSHVYRERLWASVDTLGLAPGASACHQWSRAGAGVRAERGVRGMMHHASCMMDRLNGA